tara:strand:- start:172 stop:474 length:303 start_codon:yes stop_codon:yes gene_type:complete
MTDLESEETVTELTNKEIAMEIMRDQRNIILKRSDIYVLPDFPHDYEEVRQAWITYRNNLRQLTTTQTPGLGENGELINITWPIDPNGNSGPESIMYQHG